MNNTPQTTQKQKKKISGFTIIELLVVLAIIAIILGLFWPHGSSSRKLAIRLVCGANMKGLHSAMTVYAHDNNDIYPSQETWCDLLIKYCKVTPNSFLCKGSEAIDGQSNYAMNPNCQPSSPNDIVLLFETKPGWNQQGGPELLTTENHNDKGSNILFNNGKVRFERTEELQTLKWKP
ncbi:MAG: type II secretion system protein [Planctomycetota bacterium]|jgi:prepilin-type N-terminal cleavage/methylation domain-containing protein